MILVLLGTNPYSFVRLARAVDALAGRNNWDIFMQLGHTQYMPRNGRYVSFVTQDAIRLLARQCELLITQGGAGSIHEGLAANKPVVAVPRKPELGESQDCQEDLVRALERQGRLIAVYDIAKLESAVAKARTFRPGPAVENRIPSLIQNYIGALAS